MAQTFITQEEVGLALEDGSAEIAAKLIALEWGLRLGSGVERVAGIKPAVAQVVVKFSVKGIRAGTSGNVHNSAGVAPVLSAIGGIVYLEF